MNVVGRKKVEGRGGAGGEEAQDKKKKHGEKKKNTARKGKRLMQEESRIGESDERFRRSRTFVASFLATLLPKKKKTFIEGTNVREERTERLRGVGSEK